MYYYTVFFSRQSFVVPHCSPSLLLHPSSLFPFTHILLPPSPLTFSSLNSLTFSLLPLLIFQVTSPYPLSVVRTTTTTTSAVYKLSLLSDYHSPPEPPFTNLTVSFLSPLAQQEELVLVTFAESDLSCETPPTIMLPKDSKMKSPVQEDTRPLVPSPSNHLPITVAIVVFFVLILMVMCVALQKTSTTLKSGFQSHLHPGGHSPIHPTSPAYSPITSPHVPGVRPPGVYPTASTPNIVSPPGSNIASPQQIPFYGSGLSSTAYRRTRMSSSPKQHGLFSQ